MKSCTRITQIKSLPWAVAKPTALTLSWIRISARRNGIHRLIRIPCAGLRLPTRGNVFAKFHTDHARSSTSRRPTGGERGGRRPPRRFRQPAAAGRGAPRSGAGRRPQGGDLLQPRAECRKTAMQIRIRAGILRTKVVIPSSFVALPRYQFFAEVTFATQWRRTNRP